MPCIPCCHIKLSSIFYPVCLDKPVLLFLSLGVSHLFKFLFMYFLILIFPSLSSPPSICLSFYSVHTPSAPPSSRFAVNVDGKEGKEWEEGKEWKDSGKGKELEPSRPVSVMSSLSYRKRSNIKDSIGGKGDGSSLLNTLKEQSDSQDLSSFRKNKAKQETEMTPILSTPGGRQEMILTIAVLSSLRPTRKRPVGQERAWTAAGLSLIRSLLCPL